METIKNYLETMFANMPNTKEVLRAKDELWQMMEDNYEELIAQGKSENEAVGTVISEFGNLDDLDLNLGTVVYEREDTEKRNVSLDTAKEYIGVRAKRGLFVAIGVMLCITSVCWPCMFEQYGVIGLFINIGIAVALFISSGHLAEDYEYIGKTPCFMDYATTNFVNDEYRKYKYTHNLRKTIGILMCSMCWTPAAIISTLPFSKKGFVDNLMGALLFIFVGVGVFLLIYSSHIKESYEKLLNINDVETVSGHYSEEKPEYVGKGAQLIMEIFWPVLTCGYLSVSFLTFAWHRTWIVFPIGVAIFVVLKATLVKKDAE